MTAKEISSKEVICVCDGKRLGYICDFEFSKENFCVTAFYLPESGFFSFSNKPKYRVCRDWVEKIGEDLILVRRYETLSQGRKKP